MNERWPDRTNLISVWAIVHELCANHKLSKNRSKWVKKIGNQNS